MQMMSSGCSYYGGYSLSRPALTKLMHLLGSKLCALVEDNLSDVMPTYETLA